ncbi:MAG TPA: glycosyltransferase family 4 protein [Blastocatellia bacterium]|nr:glycosyltransferase family 4 protein [Blastocatellia bacterium]
MTELGDQHAKKKKKPRALLLDLSGDTNAAFDWASVQLPNAEIWTLDKVDLKWASKRKALANVRSLSPDVFCVFARDLKLQSGHRALMIFAILAGARRVVLGDSNNLIKSRSRLGVLLVEAPRCAFEFLLGYGLVVPLYWVLIEFAGALLLLRVVVRASRETREHEPSELASLSALYVRATLTSASEGGMPTHVSGFSKGATELGHRLRFLVSGEEHDNEVAMAIAPSSALSLTKALLEIWNNLVFTVKSLQSAEEILSGVDFIYQRYSRFNCTGVLLSISSGLPFLLEFNGSETWLARNWDPVGLFWLLKRIELLNLRAADLIFVVSEVQRSILIEAGINSSKIVVNFNGVDIDRFRPNCGGADVRRALGATDRIVVGFTGTFGPWHGAPVLAEAAKLLNDRLSRCHFLFIGNGEQRARTESIVLSTAVNATFTGAIDHDRVPAYLDACDILVSPHVPSTDGSEFFGSPTKLFEYLAMEKGIVASRIGQVGDVIIDAENGLLVEPGNASELALGIERLAADEDLRRRLGIAGRSDAIARYTWRHNAARVFEAVRGLLKR